MCRLVRGGVSSIVLSLLGIALIRCVSWCVGGLGVSGLLSMACVALSVVWMFVVWFMILCVVVS